MGGQLLPVAALTVLFLWLAWGGQHYGLVEHWLLDQRFRLAWSRGAPSPSRDVVVVAIDSQSLRDVREQWPWNRRRLARVIDLLARDGARVIGLDLIPRFLAPYDTEQDTALTRAIKDAGTVVLMSHEALDQDAQELPHPMFAGRAKAVGNALAWVDDRGIVRYLDLFRAGRPSFALELVRSYLDAPAAWATLRADGASLHLDLGGGLEREVPLVADGLFQLDHRVLGRIPFVSHRDLDGERVAKGAFKDKVVLVGVTAPIMGDVFTTPLASNVGGVFVHAAAVEAILTGDFLRHPGPWHRLASALLALLAGLWLAAQPGSTRGLVGAASVCLVACLAASCAVLWNVWVDLLPVAGGIWPFYLFGRLLFANRREALQSQTVRAILDAGRQANFDLDLARQIDERFGLQVPRDGEGSTANLPPGLRLMSSFLERQYRNVQLVGKGGMGFVVRAEDSVAGRTVAIKILSPMLLDDEGAALRFQREMEVLSRLDHENVVRVYAFGEAPVPYYVMEYLEGESMRALLLRVHHLEREAFFEFFAALCAGLAHAHERGVVHRDLKPENVMVHPARRAVLVDFGLARMDDQTAITRTGIVVGTVRYMSPEAMEGREPAPAADVFSVGAMMLEALEGTSRFVDRYCTAGFVAPYWGVHLASPDARMEALIARCLEQDPLRRPPHAGALAADLGRWYRNE